jgi:hypothetical protein
MPRWPTLDPSSPNLTEICHSGRLARLMLYVRQNKEAKVQRRMNMTNIQSFAGSFLWAAAAGALMLMTFQPVDVAQRSQALQLSAKALTSAHSAHG